MLPTVTSACKTAPSAAAGLGNADEGKDGIARADYVTATGRRVVVVHVFGKKTQKTPRREIEFALERAKEVT